MEGAKALSRLSAQGIQHLRSGIALFTSIAAEFRRFIGTCIPQIVDLLKDASSDVRTEGAKLLTILSEQGMSRIWPGMVSLTSIAAEFRRFIATSIPQLTDLLDDNNSDVRVEGVKVLSKLSEQGMELIWSGMLPSQPVFT